MLLHQKIQDYINELQQLLTVSDEQTLLDTARKQWGEKDVRYEVLEQFVTEIRFNKPSAPPAESGSSSESQQNKPVK
jgi:hypothetical protein